MPEYYGAWQTVYKAFARWEKEGIFKEIFEALSKDADMQDVGIDGTYVKAHKDSAGARKKGAKKKRTAKECQKEYKS